MFSFPFLFEKYPGLESFYFFRSHLADQGNRAEDEEERLENQTAEYDYDCRDVALTNQLDVGRLCKDGDDRKDTQNDWDY